MPFSANILFYGDCLEVLRELPEESVDLIYLDPPFNSQRDYNTIFKNVDGKQSEAQILAFKDTWEWGEQTEKEYRDILRNPGAGILAEKMLPTFRECLRQNSLMAYLVMMASRIIELKRVLKNTGSIYLHCDPTASHYLKLLMDATFGAINFKNEIIWRRTGSHNNAKRFGPLHDVILFYTKSDTYTWNAGKRPYMKGHMDRYFSNTRKGYVTAYYGNVLTGPGITNGPSGQAWRGIDPTVKKRHWAIPAKCMEGFEAEVKNMNVLEKLEFLYQKGIIKITENSAWPSYELPIKPEVGAPLGDIWAFQPYTNGTVFGTDAGIDEDVRWLSPHDSERLGYPTQKPTGLLERIISASSNPGDVVLDPFCGCGTAVHAAEKLGRKWLGIDITHLAVTLIQRRMRAAFPEAKFDVRGAPKDVEAARYLATTNGLEGRYQFQYWALSLVDAMPSQDKKKGADKGEDGFIWAFSHPNEKPFKINISVKSGKIPANHIRELGGKLGKNGIEICALLTLNTPSKNMLAEALSYGYFEYHGQQFPRIQILTIAELLAGKKIAYLDLKEGQAMPKKARREIKKQKQAQLDNSGDANE